MPIINYKPPKILRAFIEHHSDAELFYSWVVGPVGSGKTTAIFFKLIWMARLQAASPDGIRRTRAVIVRNTMPQLKDTTLVSWGYWFKDGEAGHWNATDKIFTLRINDIECQVLFRPLDTPDDISRVLSLEVNFAIIDEFVELPKPIIDALSARLGRYKQPDGTPVTIWGMWGSSNPSTEDNWWYDYLHGDVLRYGESEDAHRARLMILDKNTPFNLNTTYFHQPGGLTPEAENLENLPGQRAYYVNLRKNRTEAWCKQFIDAEWGYSSAGQAVVPSFRPEWHVATKPLHFDPRLPLVIGTDPGITGSAMIFMQETYSGQVNVLRELVQRGYGMKRLITERLLPVLKNEFPDLDLTRLIFALDPAGNGRVSTDESTAKKVLTDFGFQVDCETNNRFPLRLAAYEHYTSALTEGDYALKVDGNKCPIFVRALKGGWRYAADVKKEILKGVAPDKNEYSHPGDAGGYGLRYFHRGMLRFEKYGVRGRVTLPGTSRYGVVAPGMQRPVTSFPKYHYS